MAFDTNLVPVGADQKQHVEIAQNIVRAFNAVYGNTLVVPEPKIEKNVSTIPGLDGRKMSKSYGNQIPLFAPEAELKKHIMRIVTDSSLPTDPKPTTHPLFEMYKLFATADEVKEFAKRFKNGIGWGDAKKELFNVANRELTPMREKYNFYMANPHMVDDVLNAGAVQARMVATNTLKRVRSAVGV